LIYLIFTFYLEELINSRIYKSIAFLLIAALAFVQLVLVNHRSHHSVKYSADQEQLHAFAPKCEVCEYMFTKRSDSAILSQALTMSVFERTIAVVSSKEIVPLPFTAIDQFSNKGPPRLG